MKAMPIALAGAILMIAGGCADGSRAADSAAREGHGDSGPAAALSASAAGFAVPADDYARVFQAAKDVLREHEFELGRVDAAAGVIATQPRAWAGFATPWIPFGASGRTTVEGFVQNERRAARVRFTPPGGEPADLIDLRAVNGEIAVRVEVEIQRVERPLRRPSVASARLTSYARDPAMESAGLQPSYAYLVGEDPDLAAQLARAIQDRSRTPPPGFVPAGRTAGSDAEAPSARP